MLVRVEPSGSGSGGRVRHGLGSARRSCGWVDVLLPPVIRRIIADTLPGLVLLLVGSWLALTLLLALLPQVLAGEPIAIAGLLEAATRLLSLSLPEDDSVGLGARLAVSLPLLLLALGIALVLGIPLGFAAAAHRRRSLDHVLEAMSIALALIPAFLVGIVLLLGRARWLPELPAGGFIPWERPGGAFASLLLPALALGLPNAGWIATQLRHAIHASFAPVTIEALRAVGLSGNAARRRLGWFVLRRRIADIAASSFGAIAIGLVIVENVFFLPGLGRLVLGSATGAAPQALAVGLFVLVLIIGPGMAAIRLLRLALDPDVGAA